MNPTVCPASLKFYLFTFLCWSFALPSFSADPLTVLSTSLPDGIELDPYSTQLEAAGGVAPYCWLMPGTVAGWGVNEDGQATPPGGLGDVVALAGGEYHSLALRSDGTVLAWGLNDNGQTSIPAGLSDVVAIASARDCSLAVKSDGTVVGWGNGGAVSLIPEGLTQVVSVSIGYSHALALKSDGTVVAWGYANFGQTTVPAGLANVVAVTAGGNSSLALKEDGTVVGWGSDFSGQISIPDGLSDVVSIAAGDRHALALTSDGDVVGWGENLYGQLIWLPDGLSNVVSIDARGDHSLVLKNDGTVVGWDTNEEEMVENSVDLSNVVAIAAGDYHSLALQGTGLPEGITMTPRGLIQGVTSRSGSYDLEILVQDVLGNRALEPLSLTFDLNPNTRPQITSFLPVDSQISGLMEDQHTFSATATDPEGQSITYSWTLNGIPVGTGANSLTLGEEDWTWGENKVRVTISDDLWTDQVFQEWTLDLLLRPVLEVTTSTLSGGMEMVPYSFQLEATGGVEPYRWLVPGTVSGWGRNADGEITIPDGLNDVLAIAAGEYHSLALKADGTVVTWGIDDYDLNIIPDGLTDVVSIAAGDDHNVALKSDGTVVVWGAGYHYQTTLPEGVSDVVAITAGVSHSLALKADGTVVGWGNNAYELTNLPAGVSDVVAIASGSYHNLALKSDGTVVAWGNTSFGRTEVPVGLSDVIAISAGNLHSLALKSDGTVVAWGSFDTLPAGLSDVVAISSAGSSNLALKSDGTVVAWGTDSFGQGTVPEGLSGVVSVSAGPYHSLAIQRPELPKGLSMSVRGQLQGLPSLAETVNLEFVVQDVLGTRASKLLSLSVDPNPNTIPVVLSSLPAEFSLSLFTDDPQSFSVVASDPEGQPLSYTWTLNGIPVGTNHDTLTLGEGDWILGENRVRVMVTDGLWTDQVFQEWIVSTTASPLQITTTTLPNGMELVPYATQLEASGGVKPYGWVLPGNVVGIGADDEGQMTIPAGLDDVVSVAVGEEHSLALKSDGTVVGWGDDSWGQATVPAGLTDVVQIACGEDHSLALKSNGMVVGWGRNSYSLNTLPDGVTGVVAIAAGDDHSMALQSDGTVVVWGSNSYGQLAMPTDLKNVVAIAAGGAHSLALQLDGTVIAWGQDAYGQTAVPQGLGDVVAIAAGDYHSLALKSDGTVVGWGSNFNSQLAIPTDLNNVVAISVGSSHSLALQTDGTVVAWGWDAYGQSTVPQGLRNVLAIAAGKGHTLFLQGSGLPEGLSMTSRGLIQGTTVVSGTTNLELWVRDVTGRLTSEVLSLLVEPNPNTRPVIDSFLPAEDDLVDYLNDEQGFSVVATDPEGQPLSYAWSLNGIPLGTDSESLVVGEGDWELGGNILRVSVSDGLWTDQVFQDWTLDLTFRPLQVTTTALPSAMEMVPYSAQLMAMNGVKPYRWMLPGTMEGWGLNDNGQTVIPSGLSDVVAVAAGSDHSLALKSDGTVVGWGRNVSGQTTIPVGLSDVVSIAAGESHSLALKSDGSVVAWGSNSYGKATIPEGLSDVAAVAAGNELSLALRSNGTVVGWGYDGDDQLLIPSGLRRVVSIVVGGAHCLALKSDGTVVAWGQDTDGQATVPLGLSDVISISAGEDHSLALKSDGTVTAWGKNSYGQATVPPGLNNVVAVAAGENHSLALKSDGTVVGWGDNLRGQTFAPSGLNDVVAIAAGGWHSLVLRGTDLPQGLTMSPQGLIQGAATLSGNYELAFLVQDFLGNRVSIPLNLTVNSHPNTRPEISSIVPVQTSLTGMMNEQRTFTLTASDPEGQPLSYAWSLNGAPVGTDSDSLILDEGDWIWGQNVVRVSVSDDLWMNQVFQEWVYTASADPFQITTSSLPNGMEMLSYTLQLEAIGGVEPYRWILPGEVMAWGSPGSGRSTVPAGLSDVVSIAAGESHSLALKSDGTVVAWGSNAYGKATIPEGLSNVTAIAAGDDHSLAVKDDGTVEAWGRSTFGQTTVPAGLIDVISVSAGRDHNLALTTSGTVVGWGSNSYGKSTIPEGLVNVVAVSAGYDHSLALKADGTIVAWGKNASGQATVPIGLSDVVSISAGEDFSLALKQDGTVVGWGSNTLGQVTIPSGLSDVVSIAAGGAHSLALKSDGSVVSWGSNSLGQTTVPPEGNEAVSIAAGDAHSLILSGRGLPEGLSMTPGGLIQGLPFISGTFYPKFLVQDHLGQRTWLSLTLNLDPHPNTRPEITSFTPSEIDLEGFIDDQFSFTVVAVDPEGQSLSYSWSLNGVPVGTDSDSLTLGDGDWSFGENILRVTVLDDLWTVQVFEEWTLGLKFHPLQITTMALPEGKGLVPYSMQLEATGGMAPYRWFMPGTVTGWGGNNYGETTIPAGLSDVVAVSAGDYHNLALKSDGTVLGWGRNLYGQTEIPEDLYDVIAIAAGGRHSLALKSDGSVMGWGGPASIPTGLSDVVSISAGTNHSLALKSNGTVVGWGGNYYGETLIPSGLNTVVSIAAGGYHSLALRSDGTVVGWGDNAYGQITIPAGLSDVVAIATGSRHSLALKSDGTVVGWGYNSYGQISIPAGLTDVVAIVAGLNHSLALKSDGSVVGWGWNVYNQTTVPPGTNNVLLIAAGRYHNLILQGTGLPEGVTMTPSGILQGLPTQSSTTQLDVYVQDLQGSVVSRPLTLTIQPNLPPVLSAVTPSSSAPEIPENSSQVFSVTAQDPENNLMVYEWSLNGSQVGANQNSYSFSTIWGEAGAYTLSVIVTDVIPENGETTRTWNIMVSDDNDRDGVKNTVEIFAGSDPSDPESNVKVEGMQLIQGSGQMDLTVNTVEGRNYLLEKSATLLGPWVPVGGTVIGGGGAMVIRADSPANDSPVFYRLKILNEE